MYAIRSYYGLEYDIDNVEYIDFKNALEERKEQIVRPKAIILEDGTKIDSVEAGILVKSRRLNLEKAKLKLTKAKLESYNFV